MNRRPAFTLVELLVVIAIIAVLIGLLMPAVQKIRESGNRTKCINNMKQLGLAIQMYEQTYHFYPYAATTTANPGVPKANHGTVVWLLPYIEQDAAFKAYDFSINWNAGSNVAVAKLQFPVLQCPSNPRPVQTANGYGVSDYCASSQVILGTTAYTSNAIPFKYDATKGGPALGSNMGLLNSNARCRLDDVTDGTSNTVAFFEDTGRPTAFNAKHQVIPGTISGGAWADEAAYMALHGYDDAGDLNSEGLGTCGMNCTNDNEIYSFHWTGAVFAMADGSTRYLHQLNIAMLAALTTRAGGTQESSVMSTLDN